MNQQPPDRIAMIDQVGADVRSWAQVYGSFRNALVEVGFEPYEALEVVLGWQAGLLEMQRMAFAVEHNMIYDQEDGEE